MQRLRNLRSHVSPPEQPHVVPTTRAAQRSNASPKLLTDEQLKSFIVDGFLTLRLTELGSDFHQQMYEQSKDAFGRLNSEGRDARLVYGELPQMADVITSPTLRGALSSVLGPDYVRARPLPGVYFQPYQPREAAWHAS
jgi:hypothetical protein